MKRLCVTVVLLLSGMLFAAAQESPAAAQDTAPAPAADTAAAEEQAEPAAPAESEPAADTAASRIPGEMENPLDGNQIEVITEKDTLVTMVIEYIPYTDEARFIYSCPSGLFEQGKAMNYIKERAVRFTKERGYFFYTYTRPDMTRYDNENKIASYTSYIKFLH